MKYNRAIAERQKVFIVFPAGCGWGRYDDPTPVVCSCGWCGQVKNMSHGYAPCSDYDVEAMDYCPRCGAGDDGDDVHTAHNNMDVIGLVKKVSIGRFEDQSEKGRKIDHVIETFLLIFFASFICTLLNLVKGSEFVVAGSIGAAVLLSIAKNLKQRRTGQGTIM